jgi:ABC-type transport system substrate-binding protein
MFHARSNIVLAEEQMSSLKNRASLVRSGRTRKPVGTVHVADFHALNWLYITYNTMEELVRVTTNGTIEPAAMRSYRWIDDRTLEIAIHPNERFPDGEPLTAATVERSFDEVLRWQAPHPPGTQFNLDLGTRCEITDEHTVRVHFPVPDGLALGKLRAVHIMSTRFWNEIDFGYKRNRSGEGHW